MEKLAEALSSCPTSSDLTDSELNQQCLTLLHKTLNKTTASTLASSIGGTDLLTLLDPGRNTLSYVFVLCAKFDIVGRNAIDGCWRQITLLLENYDPRQIRHASKEFRRVIEGFVKYASDVGKPIVAVRPLKKAILRSNASQFSFMHHLFTRLCLDAKCFRDAMPVLDIDVFDFPLSKNSKESDTNGRSFEVTYQDVLSFYLYGSILYMGMKNWRRAMDFLSYAVAAPGTACSKIQMEAYKKFVLVGLLLDGKQPPIPKSTPQPYYRIYNAIAKPYEAFANAFQGGDANAFRQEIALTSETFTLDGNSGLAMQCIDAFRRQRIIALRDTYVTLGVEEIAQKKFDVTGKGGNVGSREETERVILGMIERGEIQASLSQSSDDPTESQTTVCFDGNPIAEANNSHALEDQIKRIVSLTTQIKHMDRKLGLSKEYLQFLNKQHGKGGPGHPPAFTQMDSDMMDFDYGVDAWEGGDPEETVMHDFED